MSIKNILVLMVFIGPLSAIAETKAAFLIGNSEYEHTASLANPVHDIELIGATLSGLGFDVHQHINLTRQEIGRELSVFLNETEGADITLFYFAGHGMQFDGKNYLIGVDGQLATEFDVESEALDLDRVVNMLERNSRAAMVFVDACRNNPLADRFYRENFSETRALMTRGLAPITTAFEGTMMTFSASPGEVAYDGDGNSPFALSLARHLPTENIEILSVMKRVIRDVRNLTDDQQTPMLMNDLTTEIYLNLGEGGVGANIAYEQEEAMFEAALLMQSPRAWALYFQRFPEGFFKEMAILEQDRLSTQQMAEDLGVDIAAVQNEGDQPARIDVSRANAESMERALGLGKEEVKAVQAALNGLGYNAGVEDGVLGNGTRRAIANYQQAIGLPSTGVVTAATAAALGVTLAVAETSDIAVYSSRDARQYDPSQLALIERDDRLIRAVKELQEFDLVYGFYQGHLYVAVQTWNNNRWDEANEMAARMGGYLATLNSAEENQFVYDLVRHDDRFWHLNNTGQHTAIGPAFGFYQPEGSREPAGGWRWVTGEPVEFINWNGRPSNSNNDEWVGHFQYDTYPDAMETLITGPEWGDIPDYLKNIVFEFD